MASPKDILVTTTSTLQFYTVRKYLKPVTAHIVAGTNVFSDFFASFSDTFGGRSSTYQKQLRSLYAEAFDTIRAAAFELGANAIIGLSVDMDEISGKGKSMFMLTAMGTAVVVEKESSTKAMSLEDMIHEKIPIDRINTLRARKEMVAKGLSGTLELSPEVWEFATSNQIAELFPFLVLKYALFFKNEMEEAESGRAYYQRLVDFVNELPENNQIATLYDVLEKETNEKVLSKLSLIVRDLNLVDLDRCNTFLQSDNFKTRKLGVRLLSFDKPFYDSNDIEKLSALKQGLLDDFKPRSSINKKKVLLSSKEKDVWLCECGKTNDVDYYCSGCGQNIEGFKEIELKPVKVASMLEEKIALIKEYF
ncbi:MAG TPA: YbjQ family protein [Chryseolinea sp.]|nr:YbjQ family protein [Chryseolinea sp.]